MFLAPSLIHFTDCTGLVALHEITPEESFIEISRKILQKGVCPKLQVVEKGGNFFTLNNTQLHVFRRLEAQGKCPKVRVDKISLSEIPEGILRMMVIPLKINKGNILAPSSDTSRNTTKGYHKVGQVENENGGAPESENESGENASEDSEEDSESEFDWSEADEREISASWHSDETPSDDEQETLL